MIDAARMDWVGCCDHDNGDGREYSWWISQKLTDIFYTPGKFIPMFSYERSVAYPEGHRNVIFAQRGIRPLPRLPITADDNKGHAPDTQMLYPYLKHFNGIAASHTSATAMGTDWRDNDPAGRAGGRDLSGRPAEYEMPDAPRSNNEKDSIGGSRPKGYVNLALDKGYKLGFQASSDHISTHMSYCNVYAKDTSREAVLEAFKKRHAMERPDDILAEVHSGDNMMGDAFTTSKLAGIERLSQGHGGVFQSVDHQRQSVRVHCIAQHRHGEILLARQYSADGEDELLLRAGRAGKRRDRLGVADVDHLCRAIDTIRS